MLRGESAAALLKVVWEAALSCSVPLPRRILPIPILADHCFRIYENLSLPVGLHLRNGVQGPSIALRQNHCAADVTSAASTQARLSPPEQNAKGSCLFPNMLTAVFTCTVRCGHVPSSDIQRFRAPRPDEETHLHGHRILIITWFQVDSDRLETENKASLVWPTAKKQNVRSSPQR
jgi:hypothetical protein